MKEWLQSLKDWIQKLLSTSEEVSSTRLITIFTVLYVFSMGVATIFTGKFDSDVAWFLFGLFSTVVTGKTISSFTEKPKRNSHDYGGSQYDDERG